MHCILKALLQFCMSDKHICELGSREIGHAQTLIVRLALVFVTMVIAGVGARDVLLYFLNIQRSPSCNRARVPIASHAEQSFLYLSASIFF